MCNANNHPPGCQCGWGGEGHLGRRNFGQTATHVSRLAQVWLSYASYVNPNARCPACGKPVFYYQSPNGGRVFFDELGPPWPKHPCTDAGSSRRPNTAFSASAIPSLPQHYAWYATGWSPFFVSNVTSYSPELIRVSGSFQGSVLDLYILKRRLGSQSDARDIVSQSLVHLRKVAKNRFRLALLLPTIRATEVDGYVSSIDAVPLHSPNHRSR